MGFGYDPGRINTWSIFDGSCVKLHKADLGAHAVTCSRNSSSGKLRGYMEASSKRYFTHNTLELSLVETKPEMQKAF